MLALQFILTLIKKNPVKSILLGICLLCYQVASNTNDIKCDSNIISQFQDAGEYHYIIKDGKSYTIKSYEKEVKSTDGKLHYQDPHPLAIVSIIVLVLLGLFLFIATVIGDDTVGWEIEDSWNYAKMSLVRCEIEDDIYYYHYRGKMLIQSNHQLWASQLADYLNQPLNLLPDFPGTKSQRRDKKLKELLNES
jgi:hypothetical protein